MMYNNENILSKDTITTIILIILLVYGIFIYLKNSYPINKTKNISKKQNFEKYREQIKEIFQEVKTKDEWKKELLNMVLGDKAVANRLIEAERTMRPKFTEKDLIRLAVERLRRDQR